MCLKQNKDENNTKTKLYYFKIGDQAKNLKIAKKNQKVWINRLPGNDHSVAMVLKLYFLVIGIINQSCKSKDRSQHAFIKG